MGIPDHGKDYGGIGIVNFVGSPQSLVTGSYNTIDEWNYDFPSSEYVRPEEENGRLILLAAPRVYKVVFHVAFDATDGTAAQFRFATFLNGVVHDNIAAQRGIGASGVNIGSASASGYIRILNPEVALDLRVRPTQDRDVAFVDAQLLVESREYL